MKHQKCSTSSTKAATEKETAKKCIKCSGGLILGVNWTEGRQKKRYYICRTCERAKVQTWKAAHPERWRGIRLKSSRKCYAVNPEKARKHARKYYSSHQEKLQEIGRNNARKRRETNPERLMLNGAKARAKRGGLPFNITLDDIVVPPTCPALGIPLIRSRGKPSEGSPSLDKLVPSLGYVRGNVRVISHRANTLKSNATLEELQAITAYVAACLNGKEV